MVLDRNRPPYVYSKRVKVQRAKQLSNRLESLPTDELRLLKRFVNEPREPGIQQILAKPILAEYTIQELRVALAILSGVAEFSPTELYAEAGKVQYGSSLSGFRPLPTKELSLIDDQNLQTPSRLNHEIARQLSLMPEDAFLWLTQHISDPDDPRSRFIMIRYHLYRYRHKDLASTIATLIRLNQRRRQPATKQSKPQISFSSPKFH